MKSIVINFDNGERVKVPVKGSVAICLDADGNPELKSVGDLGLGYAFQLGTSGILVADENGIPQVLDEYTQTPVF